MIFIDLDGVLANFTKAFSTLIQEEYDSTMPILGPQETADWETWGGLLTPGRREYGWERISRTENFWEMLPPLASPRVFQRLAVSHKRIPIIFVTARPATAGRSAQQQSIKWLETQGIAEPLVIVAKGEVRIGTSDKADIAHVWQPDFVIEDSPRNALDYSEAGFEVALLDWPYTKGTTGPGIHRCTMDEALAMAGVPDL